MKKIAIYGGFTYHFECIGFICELFTNNNYLEDNYVLDIYHNGDNYGNIAYFKKIYSSLKQQFNYTEINNNISNYDIVFKLTSNDDVIQISHNNIFTILHKYELINYKIKNQKIITLSPLVNKEFPIHPYDYTKFPVINDVNYIFPLYNTNFTPQFNPQNTIVFIGYFLNNIYDSDLHNFFINLPEYNFIFFTSTGANPFNLPNVKVLYNCSTEEMFEYVKSCKFLLGRKIPNQSKYLFSGALSIAMSFKKPMICQEEYIHTYNLNYINFKDNYSEVIDKIKNITHEDYIILLKKINESYDLINDHNKHKISLLI